MAERRARVLMTLADVAWPVDAGKRLRAASMLRAVSALCDVDVMVLFADAHAQARAIPPDVDAAWECLPAMPRARVRAAFDVARLLVPWQIAVQDWSKVRHRVAARRTTYDLVWFGALDHFIRLQRNVRAGRVVVDCDDVETDKLRRLLALPPSAGLPWADRLQRRVELPLWARIQRRAVRAADAVLVCSELDRGRLAAQAARSEPAALRIISIPNTYPDPRVVHAFQPRDSCTLVVVANYGTDQNLDAAVFARELLPTLRRTVPGARIRLVGRRADRLRALGRTEGLDIIGPVESVADELARAHAVLVPIRFGGGTRLKVVEALAYGVPVVSTRVGAEGIDALDGEHVLLADTPEEITAAVDRLLTEPGLRQRLILDGRALYERDYQPHATQAAVGQMIGRLLDLRNTPDRPDTNSGRHRRRPATSASVPKLLRQR